MQAWLVLTTRSALDHSLYKLLTDGATLVTASRHLAHVLQNDYGAFAQQQGLTVWPTPRILPWNAYLRLACQQHRQQVTAAPRLLTEQQSLTLWERIVAEFNEHRAAPDRLLSPAQTAATAQRSWQRLHQYGIPLQQVAAYPTDEAQVFAAWADEFVARTARQGWLDSARFAQWLQDTHFAPDTALVTYGFDEVTPDMLRLLAHWRSHAVSIVQWPLPDIASRVEIVAASDADSELQLAAQWARRQVEGGAQRIGIVVPQLAMQAAEVQRRFTDVFAPAQRRIDVDRQPLAFHAIATPTLSSYPLVHHALALLQLMQGRADVLLVGQLLRSPFFIGFEQEAAQRALADVKAREQRTEVWSLNALERLALTHQCPQLAAAMQATANQVREQRSAALPSLWTERFAQWLQLSGWGRGRALDSVEQQVQNKFRQVLTELSALDELLGKIGFDTAVAAVRDASQAQRFAPESVDQAVTLIAADSVAGLQFDALWVMGVHAGDWPPPPDPDPLIPIALQRTHGMSQASAEHTLRTARQTLRQLLASAAEAVVSWPQQSGDEELRRSPLLDELDIAQSREVPLLRGDLNHQLFSARPALDAYDDDFAPVAEQGWVRGGSRVLELQSRCPFRAQAELRLHAVELPKVTPAIEPKERGILVHRVLAEVWHRLKDSAGLRNLNLNDYTATVRDIAARHAQQVLPGDTAHRQRLATLEVELCTQWVMALLAVDREREPFRVQHAEQTEHYELAGMKIRIQLDRMDALSNDGTLLIDYKTGNSQTRDWLDAEPGRPRSPQLPLYALAHRDNLEGIAFAVLRPGTAEYRGLAKRDGLVEGIRAFAAQRRRPPALVDWDALLVHWQHTLEALAQQYLSGAAYVKPLKNECQYCHLTSLCRVHELLQQVDDEAEESSDD